MDEQANAKKVKISVRGFGTIEAKTDETILTSLTSAGIMIDAVCGGQGSCGKCEIKVLGGQVCDKHGNPLEAVEDGIYLACQVYPGHDLVLDNIEKTQVSQKGEVDEISVSPGDFLPPVNKLLIKPVYPTLDHNYSLQEMISRSGGESLPVDTYALRELASVAPNKPGELTLTRVSGEIVAVEAGDTLATLFGVAFDIGSTTVAGILVDLNQGKVVAAAAETNPQAPYGADVISRIKAANTSEGLEKLTIVIRKCLNDLIIRLCAKAGISNRDIYLIAVAGNSTMEHLLMGVSPTYLAHSPYVTAFKHIPPFPGSDLGLNIHPGGRIILLPNIASFVGADTVAAVVAVEQDLITPMTLLIDLGTNGEMVLGNKEKLIVCSTAAGPAFEGAQLTSGMRAADGAIDDVTITDDVYITTINGVKPKGICGSGVIKAIAELLKVGVITDSGRFAGADRMAALPGRISRRLQEKEGQKEFILVFADASATGRDISVSQKDIREIQLVKSSICTGAEILMESMGISAEQVEQVLIAGAFGNYIDLASALKIGLVPPIPRGKIIPVGNAAGTGAVKTLLSASYLERSQRIAEQAEFVELASHVEFQKRFLGNLPFPGVTE